MTAALMLEVPVPEHQTGRHFTPAARAALEDRLVLAGLDVLAYTSPTAGDV
jgi:hypothetical protein